MRRLNPKKATGWDLIPPKVVKESADALSHPFSILFDYKLDCSTIPKQWKQCEIALIFKKDCSVEKADYRQLTILLSLSKVFEILVHIRMSPYFNDIYHKYVFAYRKYDWV